MLIQLDNTNLVDDDGESDNIKVVKRLVINIIGNIPRSVHVKEYTSFRQMKGMEMLKYLEEFQI